MFVAKEGVAENVDLEWLSQGLKNWRTLARRLKIKEAKIKTFDEENDTLSEKIYQMLLYWKQRESSNAMYTILYDALCHPLLGRKDLAELHCCQ